MEARTLHDVAMVINQRAKNYQIGKLHQIRKQIGKDFYTHKLFSKKSSKIGKEFAFHSGGRREIQFNLGYHKDTNRFRFGLAFSLGKNITLPDPIGTFRLRIIRFNEYLEKNIGKWKDLIMYYHLENKEPRSHFFPIKLIDEKLIQIDRFIFFGKYIEKTPDELDENDLDEILSTFDRLLEIYLYVEDYEYPNKNQIVKDKIARICWNSNNWNQPSGLEGKSRTPTSFVRKFGFGYDEWLFDMTKFIDGYHYGFIEPLRLDSNRHEGKVYNISLYSRHNNGRYHYIADIEKAYCVTKQESKKKYEIYKSNGWLNEMADDIIKVKGNTNEFEKSEAEYMFNIKFKHKNLVLKDHEEISPDDIPADRLRLYPRKKTFSILFTKQTKESDEGELKDIRTRKRKAQDGIEYKSRHDIIQNALTSYLRKNCRKKYLKVLLEEKYVDIMCKTIDGEWELFEIKPDSPKYCIRNALGQLLEYSYYPGRNKASKLIIIGEYHPSKDTKEYLLKIREEFGVPIYYQSFIVGTNELSPEY